MHFVYDVVKHLGTAWSVDASGEQTMGYWAALVSGPQTMKLFFKCPTSGKDQGWLEITGRFSQIRGSLDASISLTVKESLGAEAVANEIIRHLLPVYEGFFDVIEKFNSQSV